MNDTTHTLSQIIEALLFASNNPLPAKKIISLLKEEMPIGKPDVKEAIEHLKQSYAEQKRSFEIKEIAEGYILQTLPEFECYLQKLYPTKAIKLSASALEVLAIVAYKQPITRVEIEHIRGVDCSYALTQLHERQLVSNDQKLDAPGQPSLYQTTPQFLEYFGLKNLKELPPIPKDEAPTIPSEPQVQPDPALVEE